MSNKIFSIQKNWIIFNSTFCFLSAFLFVKGAIGFWRFTIMRYFDAWVNLDNFDLICLNGKYAKIWTQNSVISMYGVGFLVGFFLFLSGFYLYKKYKTKKGLLKLWFIWLYVIAVNQSFGLLIRDILLNREIFHALKYLTIPDELQIGVIILSVLIIIVIHGFSVRKFLRLATSSRDLRENFKRRILYTQLVWFPALIGSFLILIIHFWDIRDYEIIELLILILSLSIPYLLFISRKLPKKIRILKDEQTDIRNMPVIYVTTLFLIGFFIVKFVFFTY